MDRMSAKEWKRLDAARRIQSGSLTVGQAAQTVGLSKRQMRRLLRAVEEFGAKGVVHGNTGTIPAHRVGAQTRKKVVSLMRGRYAGFNDQHFTEKLDACEGIKLSKSTVRRILRDAGIAAVRKRRAPKHRKRRDRKAQAGLMILWDGSRHDWLEGRGAPMCLMGAIDDATGELLPGAHFLDQETAAAYLGVLLAIAQEKGLPWSVYMDRHGSLKRNDDHWTVQEELRGEQDPTQVGLALKALAIEAIYALSPQAKGRVERMWLTLQDRLTSELRLAKACTLQEANAVLAEHRLDHNRRFAVEATDATPAWRPVRQGIDLERLCSFRYDAAVGNDNTVRLGGHVFDIPPGPGNRTYAKARVEVRQFLDGSWRIYGKAGLIAKAASTTTSEELRTVKKRQLSKASREFREAVLSVK